MRRIAICLGPCLLVALIAVPAARAEVGGLYYQEIEDEGKVYVFNTAGAVRQWRESGEMGEPITFVGRGVDGQTVVAENETAADLYFFRHGLPGYERETPAAAPPAEPAADWSRRLSFRSADGRHSLDLANRIQVRYTHEMPDAGDDVGSFRIRRARTTLSGQAFTPELGYKLQVDWPSSSLLDAELTYAFSPAARLWLGQGKAFFGRQQLTSSGNLQFVDRTIVDGRFNPGRQIGAGLFGATEGNTFEYQAGVYNGNGVNQSRNDNDGFLTAGRLVWNPLGAYRLEEGALDFPDSARLAVGLAALNTTQGAGATEVDITRVGAEVAFKLRALSLVGEVVDEEADPVAGAASDTLGYYVQGGYLFPNRKLELAGRWAVIDPDDAAVARRTETGVAASWYLDGHGRKIQGDYRRLENHLTSAEDDEVRLQVQISF